MTILLKFLFGLLLVLITAVGLASLLIDPNAYKDQITTQIGEAIGFPIKIEGDLKLSFFPSIELEINDASIANAPTFGEEPLAQLVQARIRAKWSPLLGGHLEIDRALLNGLLLNLVRDNQGRGNWEKPTKAISAKLPHPPSSTARLYPVVYTHSSVNAINPSLVDRLSINAVELTDSRVKWTDHLIGSPIILSELKGTTGRIAAETPIGLKLDGRVTGVGLGWNTRVALDALVTADRDMRYLTLSPMELHLTELTTEQGLIGHAKLTSAIEADLTADRYLANGLAVHLSAGGGALWNATIRANLLTDLTLDLPTQTLQLSGLTVSSGALQLTSSLTAQRLFYAPTVSGRVAITEFDLRAWLSQRGLPTLRTADPAALTKVALSTDWQVVAGRLDLQDMKLILDQNQVTGHASRLPSNPAAYRFGLEADALDLDPYLSLAVSGPTPTAFQHRQQAMIIPVRHDPTAAPAVIAATAMPVAPGVSAIQPPGVPLFPIELVRLLDIEGRFNVGELRVAKLMFGNANLHIAADKGQLRINNSVKRFYDGHLDGRLELDAQTDSPTLSIEQHAAGIQTGPMLKDLTGDDALTGRGEITTRLNATGHDLDAIKRSLNGELQLNLADGAIKGFDIQQMIREAEAKLTGKPAPPWRPARTEFTTLTASAVIRDGVLHNDDLSGTSEYLHVSGHGVIDIGNARLDYRLAPRLVDPPEGRGIKEIEDIPIPVHLTGDFQNPKWNVELGPILREMANRGLGEDLEEKAGQLIRKLEESTGIKGLEQGLKGLFGF